MFIRPRRSVLYMPASNQRALEKARTLPADCLVFDLEDSVDPGKKVLAREQAVAAVQTRSYGQREVVIRVNGLTSPWWKDDVHAVAHSGADAICLPKVENMAQLNTFVGTLNNVGAPVTMGVWMMTETPLGVLNIQQLAGHERVNVIVMGTTDLAKELRVPHTPDRIGLLNALSQCVLAARACNVDILDGVYLDLHDTQGFAAACQQGKELGFDGKTLIHPGQLAQANVCFGPDSVELARAENIIACWKQAQAKGEGVAVLEGKLVESMHVDEAQRHLAIAAAIRSLSGP